MKTPISGTLMIENQKVIVARPQEPCPEQSVFAGSFTGEGWWNGAGMD